MSRARLDVGRLDPIDDHSVQEGNAEMDHPVVYYQLVDALNSPRELVVCAWVAPS